MLPDCVNDFISYALIKEVVHIIKKILKIFNDGYVMIMIIEGRLIPTV